MRIMLRKSQTDLYLDPSGNWTNDLRQARSFAHGAEAVHLAYKLGVDCPELVMQFDHPASSFAVALSEEGGPAAPQGPLSA